MPVEKRFVRRIRRHEVVIRLVNQNRDIGWQFAENASMSLRGVMVPVGLFGFTM